MVEPRLCEQAQKNKVPAGVAARLALLGHASMLLRRWHLRAEFRRLLPGRLASSKYGQLLRTTLAEWRVSLENSTARRKQGLRKLMAQAAEHDRTHIALPHAWLDWCAPPRLP